MQRQRTFTESNAMSSTVQSITPVLLVERVEPALAFWRDRLGFEVLAEVPHEDAMGFVMLGRDGLMVMYQSYASVAADVPALAHDRGQGVGLFIQVESLDAIEKALDGVPLVHPRRRTFYGMDEIIVREPAGFAVTFAQQVAE
jgi:uncharacterized glyoxalase superfamily protein PhnB